MQGIKGNEGQRILLVVFPCVQLIPFLHAFLTQIKHTDPDITCDLWIEPRWRKTQEAFLFFDWAQQERLLSTMYHITVQTRKKNASTVRSQHYKQAFGLGDSLSLRMLRCLKFLAPHAARTVGIMRDTDEKVLTRMMQQLLSWWYAVSLVPAYFAHNDSVMSLVTPASTNLHPTCLEIPRPWRSYAELKLLKWGVRVQKKDRPVVLMSPFGYRSWPLLQVERCIDQICQQGGAWEQALFIIHAPKNYLTVATKFFTGYAAGRTVIFDGDDYFWQFPALCHYASCVIAVDSAAAHLAVAVGTPTVVLCDRKTSFITTEFAAAHPGYVISLHGRRLGALQVQEISDRVMRLSKNNHGLKS